MSHTIHHDHNASTGCSAVLLCGLLCWLLSYLQSGCANCSNRTPFLTEASTVPFGLMVTNLPGDDISRNVPSTAPMKPILRPFTTFIYHGCTNGRSDPSERVCDNDGSCDTSRLDATGDGIATDSTQHSTAPQKQDGRALHELLNDVDYGRYLVPMNWCIREEMQCPIIKPLPNSMPCHVHSHVIKDVCAAPERTHLSLSPMHHMPIHHYHAYMHQWWSSSHG